MAAGVMAKTWRTSSASSETSSGKTSLGLSSEAAVAAEDDDRRNSLRISIKQERLSEILFAQPFQILKTRNFIEQEYQRQMHSYL